MSRRQLASDDRAAVSPVSNVLTIGITTVLILGLIIGATGLLSGQQEETARSELRTVGEALAVELEQVATLAHNGGKPNVTSQRAGRVVGDRYSVKLLSGSECDSYRVPSDTCLRLSSQNPDVTQYVPVNNDSSVNVYLESEGQGEFSLSARSDETGSAGSTDISDTDLSSRIGVGRDISSRRITLGSTPGNRPPVARFTYRPASPQDGDEIEFDASESFDADGSIEQYLWDFNGDGAYEESTSNPVFTRSLSAGNYNVSLRVVDDVDATSDRERFVDVSGLGYNGDLRTGGSDDDAEFTLTNNFDSDVEITHVMLDPADDDIDFVADIIVSGDTTGVEDDGRTIYDDGRIVELESPARVSDGSDATVRLRGFDDSVDGKQFTIGVQYELNGVPNSTKFTDTVNGVSIRDYEVTSSGTDVDVSFESTKDLSTIRVEYGGAASGTLTESDFSETNTGSGYRYTADISDGTDGFFWGNLTQAETGSAASRATPINDSTVTTTGPYVWSTSSDWDDATDEQGVVHANFGDHDADQVELGYTTEDENGDGLVGYWPLDDTSSVPDVSGTGNDGIINGGPTTAAGVFGTDAYNLDGTDDYVEIPDDSSLEMSDDDTVTVSAWVNVDADQVNNRDGWVAIFQKSDQSYNLQFGDGNEPEFTIYDGGWNSARGGEIKAGEWYHYVGVYDGDTIEMWVNGTRVSTEDGADFIDDSGNENIGLGQNIDTGDDRHLDGQIDEVRLYDRALSDNEVRSLYETHEVGTLTTDWKSGASNEKINLNNHVSLRYIADIGSGESVDVRVHAKESGNTGTVTSEWVTLSDGSDEAEVSFPSAGGTSNEYRLEIKLESDSPRHAPSVDSLEVFDDS